MPHGQIINMSSLSSKGYTYLKDIEIYIKPMSLKDEIASAAERFSVSKAGYYESLLDSIEIKGRFNKRKLLFSDIQLIDLVRRIYTFDLEEAINIKDCKCGNCGKDFNISFKLHEVNFTDFSEEIFGKEFTFSDGLTVKVSPITMDSFIKINTKYLTNVEMINGIPDIGNYIMGYYAASVIEVKDRVFENQETMQEFMFKYFSNIFKAKDKKLIGIMDKELTSTIVPFVHKCDKCSKSTEVFLDPSMEFFQ